MPIRVAPFESINSSMIEELRERRVREDRTLEYKREIDLGDRDLKSEFLKDVTAFANGSGGTLLYGVEEGRGENEGVIIALPGLALEPDAIHRMIDNLLRDAVDERATGILHRAISRPDGRFYYVVRVPPSPLAPHMVTIGRHSSKFFIRANATSYAMDARQVKESALRTASALDRARAIIEERRHLLVSAGRLPHEDGGRRDHQTDDVSQILLHAVPLFPIPGGFELSDSNVVERLAQVPILGWSAANNSRRFTLDGFHTTYNDRVRAAFLRSGAVEFQEYGVQVPADFSSTAGNSPPTAVLGWRVEQGALMALDACAGLTTDGLLPLPLVISLTLVGVRGSHLSPSPTFSWPSPGVMELDDASITPIVLHSWDKTAAVQVRGIFNEMYQGWGFAGSTNYEDTKRIWWRSIDRVPAPSPSHWATGWDAGF